jgi:DNA end-binding protein Ku
MREVSIMQRAIWKGAISFGLINIPVMLFAAEKRDELDFTMLDKRDMSPVGYKRISKKSGKEVAWDDIVKGYEYEDGKFVLLSDEDLRRANVAATQSIDIQCFTDANQVPVTYYEQPYYLAPMKPGGKAYALLRETLRKTGKMAIAKIVIRTREHIAAVMPFDNMLNLITLRYPAELKLPADLDIAADETKRSALSAQEIAMALSLVESMSAPWDPDSFHDTYRDDVLELVRKKIKSGRTRAVAPDRPHRALEGGGNVIDLMALLKKSIADKAGSGGPSGRPAAARGRAAGAAPKKTGGGRRAQA